MKPIRFHQTNLAKHEVMISEAAEALVDGWARRRRDAGNYEVLGRTLDGKYLQLVVEDRGDYLWLFHGREMTEIERKRYRRK